MPVDASAAVGWYKRAASKGDATGQYNLALKLETGNGVTKDMTRAVHWYRRAALQGEADAQRRLGELYSEGADIDPDPALALAWFRLAAEYGDKSDWAQALARELDAAQLAEAEDRLVALKARLAR